MQKYIDVTGKNDEEALAKGLAQLGLDRDDVSVEVLSRGRTGFLGIGSVPAKVRLTYEAPDPEPVREEVRILAAPPVPPKETVKEPDPVAESGVYAEPPVREAVAARGKRERRQKSGVSKPSGKPAKETHTPKAEPDGMNFVPVEKEDEVASAIIAYQTGLFTRMGVEATPVVTHDGDTYMVTLEGENLAVLIGHRGETLDAVQQLTAYSVNRGRPHRVRVRVDAESYRARREESLSRLAHKTAAKARKFHRSVALEPMNAYERHVIHAALQDVEGVSTHSTGVEPNRRVIVSWS